MFYFDVWSIESFSGKVNVDSIGQFVDPFSHHQHSTFNPSEPKSFSIKISRKPFSEGFNSLANRRISFQFSQTNSTSQAPFDVLNYTNEQLKCNAIASTNNRANVHEGRSEIKSGGNQADETSSCTHTINLFQCYIYSRKKRKSVFEIFRKITHKELSAVVCIEHAWGKGEFIAQIAIECSLHF